MGQAVVYGEKQQKDGAPSFCLNAKLSKIIFQPTLLAAATWEL